MDDYELAIARRHGKPIEEWTNEEVWQYFREETRSDGFWDKAIQERVWHELERRKLV